MQSNKFIMPLAIIIAGGLIGAAIFFGKTTPVSQSANTATVSNAAAKADANIKPISDADHIFGSPNAKVMMVEYSDTECPFCKLFNVTMKKVMDTYGGNGTVAWVYRHFPIAQLHPKAPHEAEATECVKELGGETKFWEYIGSIYTTTPANNGLDPAQLPILAKQAGVDVTAFNSCLASGKYTKFIADAVADAQAAGGHGTPYTVIVTRTPMSDATAKNVQGVLDTAGTTMGLPVNTLGYVTTDKKVVFEGNLPYDLVQQVIAAMIS